MYITKRLVFFTLAGLVLAGLAAWAALTLTIRQTPDGILVLYAKQARECDEGGGCSIFSQREFEAAVYQILARQQRKSILDT